MFKRIILFLLFSFVFSAVSFAQDDDYDDGETIEMQRKSNRAKKKRLDEGTEPLTERQGQKAMADREKNEKKAYKEHHNRIQSKEVKKRMRKNKKKSNSINSKKKPGFFKNLFH